jgi:SAM-dependent methyltransferase
MTELNPGERIPHQWPIEIEPGLIPTSNAMGIMTREPAPVALKFAEHAGRADRPVLEVGAAYGNASYPALEAGGTVIACDLAEDELAKLRAPVPRHMQKRLITIPARFPEQLRFTPGSLSAILAAQVLHFFDGATVQSALSSAFRWLEPGDGRLYLVVMTPQLSYYIKFLPEFQRRKVAGDPWPGTFDPRLGRYTGVAGPIACARQSLRCRHPPPGSSGGGICHRTPRAVLLQRLPRETSYQWRGVSRPRRT